MNSSNTDRRLPLGLVKTSVVYTHVLNRGGEGLTALSTGCSRFCSSRVGGRSGASGPHNIPEANV
jgi:hypothetical protein